MTKLGEPCHLLTDRSSSARLPLGSHSPAHLLYVDKLVPAALDSPHFPGLALGHTKLSLSRAGWSVGRKPRDLPGGGAWPGRVKGSQGWQPRAHPVEWLCHLPQEVLGHLHPFIHGQVEVRVTQVLLDPAGQLPPLVRRGEPLGRRVRVSGPLGCAGWTPCPAPRPAKSQGSRQVGGARPAPCQRRP